MILLKNMTVILAFGWGAFSCAMDMDYPGSSTYWQGNDDCAIDPHYPYCVDGSNDDDDDIKGQKTINPYRNPTNHEEVVKSTEFKIASLLRELKGTEKRPAILKDEREKNKDISLQVNDKVRLGTAALAKTMADGLHAKL